MRSVACEALHRAELLSRIQFNKGCLIVMKLYEEINHHLAELGTFAI